MKKIVKQYGNSLVIVFNKEDSEIYGLKEGDIIDLELCKQLPTSKNTKNLIKDIKEVRQ